VAPGDGVRDLVTGGSVDLERATPSAGVNIAAEHAAAVAAAATASQRLVVWLSGPDDDEAAGGTTGWRWPLVVYVLA
jgi:hypothetical protein